MNLTTAVALHVGEAEMVEHLQEVEAKDNRHGVEEGREPRASLDLEVAGVESEEEGINEEVEAAVPAGEAL